MNNKNNLPLEYVDESLVSYRLPPTPQTTQTAATSRSALSWLRDKVTPVTTTWSNLRTHRWFALSVGLGVVGSLVYAGPSWNAAKSLSSETDPEFTPWYAYPIVVSSVITNVIFFSESLLRLMPASADPARIFDISTKKSQLTSVGAAVSSVFCTIPLFFLSIDKLDLSKDSGKIMFSLQCMSAGINLIVNAIFSKDMLEAIVAQPASPEAQLRFSKAKKVGKHVLISGLGVLALIPTSAFVACSYFGIKNLTQRFDFISESASMALGGVTAFGNAIPSLGLVYKGVKFVTSTILETEYGRPSVPMCVVIAFVPLSGFASYQAMIHVLKDFQVQDESLTRVLPILAALGTVITCNGPIAMLWCKNTFGAKPQSRLQLREPDQTNAEEALRLVTIQDGQPKRSVQLSTMGPRDSEAVLHIATVHRPPERSVQSPEVGHGESKKTLSLVTVPNGQLGNNIARPVGTVRKVGIFKVNSQPLVIDPPVEHDSQRMVRFNSI